VQPAFSATFAREFAADWAAILGRPASRPGPDVVPGITGRTVLITGGGGFIGSEMVRVLAASGASRIVLLEIAEQPLFNIHSEMTARGFADRCIPVLGSVCDRGLLATLFVEHRPDLILHAAALKHVPLMERNPFAAVATNAIGSWTLAQIAADFGVSRLILVSTDKAVAPHSIMGVSKRVAELVALAHGFTAVRLVNVMGSPGSVGPVFAEQIARGGPVTVTDRAARRFFLTLGEVIALLAEAIAGENSSGILVPDPGDPIFITDLAGRMIGASRHEVPIVFTELRAGDKLDESLLSMSESFGEAASCGLRHVISPAALDLENRMHGFESAIAARDLAALLREAEALVPDYTPSALLSAAALSHASGAL
jgi:FlaA1/EpsC-like NDP-sugar epimerase